MNGEDDRSLDERFDDLVEESVVGPVNDWPTLAREARAHVEALAAQN